MKVVFFGTPGYVIPVLEKLYKFHKIVAVITQPPRKAGRDQKLTYSPVDDFAHKRNIEIILDPLEAPTAELGVCAAYGRIIPESVIGKFRYGILNVHPSLLPNYRGASPIQAAITNGDSQTGLTIIKMDEKMDHGPIVTFFKEDINPDDTGDTLRDRLFERSAQVLIDLIPKYVLGKINLKSQNHSKATFTKILKKENGYIDLKKKSQEEAERFIRAMQPWPQAWTTLKDGKRLKLLKSHLEDGNLILDEVQLEGKTPVTGKQFETAYPGALPS
jgi:methionyl-tRNA formyltransferase